MFLTEINIKLVLISDEPRYIRVYNPVNWYKEDRLSGLRPEVRLCPHYDRLSTVDVGREEEAVKTVDFAATGLELSCTCRHIEDRKDRTIL